jgi:hypothetical protein
MNTDNNTSEDQPQRETPRDSTVQEEQGDDDHGGVSVQRQDVYDEKKAEEEAIPSDGGKLPEPKALDYGPSDRVVRKKDVKIKRDLSSTAVRPGAVSVPGTGATATTSTAREPSGNVPQTTQLCEPDAAAGPSTDTKKKPLIQPGAVVVQGALTQQNTKLRIGPQQPRAVAVQGPDAAVRKKGSTETAAAMRKRGSERASQPREPTAVAGRATTAMKGSEDQDIESGLLVPASGMVDAQQENFPSGGVSSGAVRPGAVAVQPGTPTTTQNAEMSAFPAPTMHTSSPSILTSKAAIAKRTAAVRGKASRNGAAGVADGALPVSDKSWDKDESGALSEAAEEPRVGAVAVPAAAGMETLDMARPSSYVGAAVAGDNDVYAVPRAMLVTADAANEVDREAIFYEARLAAEADVRQQMTTKVVNAEIVDVSNVDQQRRRRRCLQLSLLALVVIVAAVVGGVVGSQSSGGSKALPSSMAPSMSASPSAAPTETPNNDFCDEALDVTGDDTVVTESLQNTTVETRRTCSSGDEIEQRGRWYEYTGNGLGLTVEMQSAVEDETALEVLVGTCEELQCTETVASSNTTLNFVTAENTAYLIHVFSTLDAMSEPSEDYNLKISDNSGCGNAYPVDIDTQTLYSGSTAAAAVSDLAPSCGSATVGVSPGVWFEVAGDGMNIEASTCGGASFDTQISVYTGVCGSLECVVGNNDFCGSRSSVLWLSRVSIWAAL